jgi:hypothetical protein
MPAARYEPRSMSPIGEIIADSEIPPGVSEYNSARIKRVRDGELIFSRGAPVLASAEFETQVVPMGSLTELFGLTVGGYYQGPLGQRLDQDISASVSLQISVNGGTSYLYWDDAAWSAAVAGGNFTSVEVFNEQCDQFVNRQTLLNPKSVGFRIKLSKYTHTDFLDYTPVLTLLVCHVEWTSDPYLDLFTTTKSFIEQNFRTTVLRRHVLTEAEFAARAFVIDTNYTVDAAGDFLAFNITQDANKNTNIFTLYTAATDTVSLAAGVAGGDVIEFTFDGSSPVHVTRPDEMVTISDIPSVVVTVGPAAAVVGRHVGRLLDYKLGTTKKLLRSRNFPVYRSCSLRVEAWARSAREAVTSIQSLERILTEGLQSEATGEIFSINLTSPGQLIDYGNQSYYSGTMEFTVYYFDHSESYEEVPAVSSIVQRHGDFARTFANTTSTNVGVTHEIL